LLVSVSPDLSLGQDLGEEGGEAGREALKLRCPHTFPLNIPKLHALTDLGKMEAERKGFGSSQPFGDQGQIACPGRIAIPSIQPLSMDVADAALHVCWPGSVNILS